MTFIEYYDYFGVPVRKHYYEWLKDHCKRILAELSATRCNGFRVPGFRV